MANKIFSQAMKHFEDRMNKFWVADVKNLGAAVRVTMRLHGPGFHSGHAESMGCDSLPGILEVQEHNDFGTFTLTRTLVVRRGVSLKPYFSCMGLNGEEVFLDPKTILQLERMSIW